MSESKPAIAALLVLVLLVSGCVGLTEGASSPDEPSASEQNRNQGQNQSEEPETPYPERSREGTELEGSIGTGLHGTGYAPTDLSWTVDLPSTLVALEGELAWGQPGNELGIQIVPPRGPTENHTDPLSPTTASFEAETLTNGTYEIVVTARGATVEDQVTLQLDWTRVGPDWIDVEDRTLVHARATERVGGVDADVLDLALDTREGSFDRVPSELVYLEANRHATRKTAFGAVQAVKDVQTSIASSGHQFEAFSYAPRYASVDYDLRAPDGTNVHGRIETYEGKINLSGLRMQGDLHAETWGGNLVGDLELAGGIFSAFVWGNARLELTPQTSSKVRLDVDNGRLRLHEAADVAWNLTIDAANGQAVDNGLEEAVLDEIDGGYRLHTPGYHDRTILVDGHIEFDGDRLSFRPAT